MFKYKICIDIKKNKNNKNISYDDLSLCLFLFYGINEKHKNRNIF